MATILDRLRTICLALPEAHEVEAWGTPTFRVKNKLFAMWASSDTHVGKGRNGVWLNFGSAVILPETFLKAVAVVRNFGHSLDGLTTVNVDKEIRYRTKVNVVERPSDEGLELTGHHEILLPLMHAAVNCRLAAAGTSGEDFGAAA